MSNVVNLFDTYAVQCECGSPAMMLIRSGKIVCSECRTEWTNLTWSCRDCPGNDSCCRNGGRVGEHV